MPETIGKPVKPRCYLLVLIKADVEMEIEMGVKGRSYINGYREDYLQKTSRFKNYWQKTENEMYHEMQIGV